jgi:hypothetical protein
MNLTALLTHADRCIERPARSDAAFRFDARLLSAFAAIDATEPSPAAILVNRPARAGTVHIEPKRAMRTRLRFSGLATRPREHRIR